MKKNLNSVNALQRATSLYVKDLKSLEDRYSVVIRNGCPETALTVRDSLKELNMCYHYLHMSMFSGNITSSDPSVWADLMSQVKSFGRRMNDFGNKVEALIKTLAVTAATRRKLSPPPFLSSFLALTDVQGVHQGWTYAIPKGGDDDSHPGTAQLYYRVELNNLTMTLDECRVETVRTKEPVHYRGSLVVWLCPRKWPMSSRKEGLRNPETAWYVSYTHLDSQRPNRTSVRLSTEEQLLNFLPIPRVSINFPRPKVEKIRTWGGR